MTNFSATCQMSAPTISQDHNSQSALLQAISLAGEVAIWNWRPNTEAAVSVYAGADFLPLPEQFSWVDICDHDSYRRLLSEFRKMAQGETKRFRIYVNFTIKTQKTEVIVAGGLVYSNGSSMEFAGVIQAISSAPADRPNTPEKSRFLANISHELRTPIHGILGIVELALDSAQNHEVSSYLKSIRAASSVLLCIVNDVLDFSRLEAGRAELLIESFDTRNLVREVLDIFSIQAEKKGVNFYCEIVPTVPRLLAGDMQRIRQILINLVGNAVKFTTQGEVALHVAGSVKESTSTYMLKISIRDTGIGIPSQKLGEVFEPFVQADQSTARKYGGTGLGLALSKKLLQQMGGKIDVRSVERRGTVFSVAIPLSLSNTDEIIGASYGTQPFPTVGLAIKSPRTHGILKRTLALAGYTVADCSEPTSHEIDPSTIDVWIMDAISIENNCQRNGFVGKQARRILLSSILRHGSDENIVKKYGIEGHLRLPFTDIELFEAITSMGGISHKMTYFEQQQLDPDMNFIEAGLAPEVPKKRILVVDDDSLNLQVLDATLTREGFIVETAENGERALDKFEIAAYDLIVMDIQMPVMDGIATTEAIRLREMRRSWVSMGMPLFTPILGFTADTRESVSSAARDAGMNDLFIKGIPRAALVEKIRAVIQQNADSDRFVD